MFRFKRNKSELIVLTGAIYSFVAYLTAFTLEILFLIDLTRQNGDHLLSASSSLPAPVASPPSGGHTAEPVSLTQQLGAYFNNQGAHHEPGNEFSNSFEQFTFEAMQAHHTISCLAISILYFIIFITSLILIVALILRSTFMLLIWMCAMATMYLPEFGLVTYVSVYSWGLGTRNGQVELAFYLFRSILNLIFIFRAHKLFKQWTSEKNFFRLKSTGAGAFGPIPGHYDTPYFITGDSLTTTINPMYSNSTLNLNRYDYVRGSAYVDHEFGRLAGSGNTSPITNQSVFSASDQQEAASSGHGSMAGGRGRLATASQYSRELANNNNKYALPLAHSERRFYLGAGRATGTPSPPATRAARNGHTRLDNGRRMQRNESMLSINDDDLVDGDYEMDLDYRTLNRQRGTAGIGAAAAVATGGQQSPSARYYINNQRRAAGRGQEPSASGAYHYNYNQPVAHDHNSAATAAAAAHAAAMTMMSKSQDNLTYSTQSLDRRHLRDLGGLTTEQVILRPLGHQPFEYLQRPGSTSNLNTIASNNPGARSSNTRLYHYGS